MTACPHQTALARALAEAAEAATTIPVGDNWK